jgi:lipid-A-disaccharide synthase
VLVCADVALAASGTVTVEACLLGTPMVTFYRVNKLSWWMGKALVRVPFYSMVNLVAGRRIVPELIQDQMTPEALAREAQALIEDESAAESMRRDLAEVAEKLSGTDDPLDVAAALIAVRLPNKQLKEEVVHVS